MKMLQHKPQVQLFQRNVFHDYMVLCPASQGRVPNQQKNYSDDVILKVGGAFSSSIVELPFFFFPFLEVKLS